METFGNLGFFSLSVPGVLKVLDRDRMEPGRAHDIAPETRPGNMPERANMIDIPVDRVGAGVVQYHCNSSAMFRGG